MVAVKPMSETGGTEPAPSRAGLIEVPVLSDASGRSWLLPACRLVPGGADGDLLESADVGAALSDSLLDAARLMARRLGPGRHDVTFAISAGSQPRLVPDSLDGWALAEELVGVDLASGPGTPSRTDRGQALPAALSSVQPPPASGHAVEARLRAASASANARLLHRRLPQGPGVRVVQAAEVGSVVGDAVLLRVVAHGMDRPTALARLQRALASCAMIVENAPTNRCDLLAALAAQLHPGRRALVAASDPLAVLVAAVRASDAQRAIQRDAFHARAARGRPEPADASGISTTLVHGGHRYALVVHETGPLHYRIDTGDQVAELARREVGHPDRRADRLRDLARGRDHERRLGKDLVERDPARIREHVLRVRRHGLCLVPQGAGVDEREPRPPKVLHHARGRADVPLVQGVDQDDLDLGHAYRTARTVAFSTEGPASYTALPTTIVSAYFAISAACSAVRIPPP